MRLCKEALLYRCATVRPAPVEAELRYRGTSAELQALAGRALRCAPDGVRPAGRTRAAPGLPDGESGREAACYRPRGVE